MWRCWADMVLIYCTSNLKRPCCLSLNLLPQKSQKNWSLLNTLSTYLSCPSCWKTVKVNHSRGKSVLGRVTLRGHSTDTYETASPDLAGIQLLHSTVILPGAPTGAPAGKTLTAPPKKSTSQHRDHPTKRQQRKMHNPRRGRRMLKTLNVCLTRQAAIY